MPYYHNLPMVPNVKEVHNLKVLLQTKNLVSSKTIFSIFNEDVQDSNLSTHNYQIIIKYIYKSSIAKLYD